MNETNNKKGERHYFTPSEENNRFCARCGQYLTDEAHVRATEEEKKRYFDLLKGEKR